MKRNHWLVLKQIIFIVFSILGLWACLLPQLPSTAFPIALIGIQPASASNKYGILGRSAPELELDSWIDGEGKEISPIGLNDYLGKVVYLYFFQDW